MLPILNISFGLKSENSSSVNKTHHRSQDDIVICTSILQQNSTSIEPRHYNNERNTCEQNTRHDEWNGG